MLPTKPIEFEITEAIDKLEFAIKRNRVLPAEREWTRALAHTKEGLKFFRRHKND